MQEVNKNYVKLYETIVHCIIMDRTKLKAASRSLLTSMLQPANIAAFSHRLFKPPGWTLCHRVFKSIFRKLR